MKQTLTNRIRSAAFTLIELMIVVGIIAALAAMIFPAFSNIKKRNYLIKARAELKQVELAIGAYKARNGYFPPDNRLNPGLNTLYFELKGTKLNGNTFQTLDGSISLTDTAVPTAFANVAIGGLMNCTRGGGDESAPAQDFLRELKPGQFVQGTNNGVVIRILTTTVPLPNNQPAPLPSFSPTDPPGNKPNPWRYNSSNPTNNPGQFDLWVDIIAGGKTHRISNWSSKPEIIP